MKDYKEYMLNLVSVYENLILLNKNENMFNFIHRCRKFQGTSQVMNFFDKDTLAVYDTVVRLLANTLFERIPAEEELPLDDLPKIEEFRSWAGSLSYTEWYVLLYFLYTRGYLELQEDENLQYMINVHRTLEGMNNAK
jgi:hypothetical protein